MCIRASISSVEAIAMKMRNSASKLGGTTIRFARIDGGTEIARVIKLLHIAENLLPKSHFCTSTDLYGFNYILSKI